MRREGRNKHNGGQVKKKGGSVKETKKKMKERTKTINKELSKGKETKRLEENCRDRKQQKQKKNRDGNVHWSYCSSS